MGRIPSSRSCAAREDPKDFILFCCNFTPVPRQGYEFGVPEEGFYQEILNTDSELFGGSNMGNGGLRFVTPVPMHNRPHSHRRDAAAAVGGGVPRKLLSRHGPSTMPSSSAAATTAWSPPPTWRAAGARCWCWSGANWWAAARSPKRSGRAIASPPPRISPACCRSASSASWNCRASATRWTPKIPPSSPRFPTGAISSCGRTAPRPWPKSPNSRGTTPKSTRRTKTSWSASRRWWKACC